MTHTHRPSRGVLRAALLSLAILAPGAVAQPSSVVVRAGTPDGPRTVLVLDPDGVSVARNADEKPLAVLSWDRVVRVEGPLSGEAARFADTAEKAWRARVRLERGDFAGAEPLFEELFSTYRGRGGVTAGVISSGLARCRLARGVQISAIEPWLAWVLTGSEIADSSWRLEAEISPDAGPVIDAGLGLVPLLPPILTDSAALRAFSREDLAWANAKPGSRAAVLAGLYRAAALFEAGSSSGVSAPTSGDPGVMLVSEIVLSRVGDGKQRRDSRRNLAERLKHDQPAWVEVWCRVALGRSLLLESPPEEKLWGVVELLHVPARLPRVNPLLTGLALSESAVTLWNQGDDAGARHLKSEISRLFPGHPILSTDALRVVGTARPTPTPAAPDSDKK